MEIYLIRHTKPLISKDVCYGQTDIPVDESVFIQSTETILKQLPEKIGIIYSSPLIRCRLLSEYLQQNKYHSAKITYSNLLKELDFGEWENKKWNDIDQNDLQKWMNDFVNESIPGGENFIQLHKRTQQFIKNINTSLQSSAIVVTHAGVIRSLISHIEESPLKDAFSISCEYASMTHKYI